MKSIGQLNDIEWKEYLLRSLHQEVVEGVKFSKFPSEELQANFVGSSAESALKEGFKFYDAVKKYWPSVDGGADPVFGRRFLDFGCGWGRFMRIFRKDFRPDRMYGVDIDPTVIEVCRDCGVDGNFSTIQPRGQLPFPNNYFDTIIAYSVFTHLPEDIHNLWIRELARVSRPGCIFALTLEPLRFLDFIEDLQTSESESGWHKNLKRFCSAVPEFKNQFHSGEFVYIPTGGGDIRTEDVYGEAVIPVDWVRRSWDGLFEVLEYTDDPDQFWQALVIARRQ